MRVIDRKQQGAVLDAPPRLMTGDEYRESLRRLSPTVYVNGRKVETVADEPLLTPGVNAIAVTYDVAHRPEAAPLARAVEQSTGRTVSRFLHIDRSSDDLLSKLELVRLVCQETGCAQRYLAHDALNASWQATYHLDAELGGDYHQRFRAWLGEVQDHDLTIGVAMTDAKGDRSLHPHEQPNADAYVHVVERRADGVVISGAKAIVTGAPYVHQLLVMPCRNMEEADADFAVCCAIPVDAPGVTIVARPAGRPGEAAAKFSARYGQSTGVVLFDRVFVPHERVFLAGEWRQSLYLTQTYATHHRHTCVAARAGFGDLLIALFNALLHLANRGEIFLQPPLIRLADGRYLVGDHTDGWTEAYVWYVSEFSIASVRWRLFDPQKVITTVAPGGDGKGWVNADLSKIDEVGFVDLMPGSSHGNGGFSDVAWIEVTGRPVPRNTPN